ncbi:dual specificity protein phosphatase 10-like [Leucoraja erinacea]|uniref:dual specificity protein phosphatase 10-like n=1 Tax=Leucoraja erinaceus TaxID=7782 RepID=UPI00245859F6|nr:dual specificity protein phosphatase 10-like [Leucoraja erinacea]
MQQLPPGLGRRAVQRQAALQLSPPSCSGGMRPLKCGCWRLMRRGDCSGAAASCMPGLRALGGCGPTSSALRRLSCLPCMGCEPGVRSMGSSCSFCSSDPIVSYRARGEGRGRDHEAQSQRPQSGLILDCRGLVEFTKMQLHGEGAGSGAGSGGHQPRLTVFDLLSGRNAWCPPAPNTGIKTPQATRPFRQPCKPTAPHSLHLLLNPLGGLNKRAATQGPAVKDVPPDAPTASAPSLPLSPEVESAELSPILPFLYLGSEHDAQDLGLLRRLDVAYVINATTHLPLYHAPALRYKRFPVNDSGRQNLRQYFEEAFEFIEEGRQSGKGVLVHCQAGVSRSATLVIAYLMKHTLMTMTDAYKYVKGKRPIISPNLNFMGQLLEFEMDLNEGLSPRILTPRLSGLETQV